jgi:energy-coupling factor transporter transmembrane protein EcfT
MIPSRTYRFSPNTKDYAAGLRYFFLRQGMTQFILALSTFIFLFGAYLLVIQYYQDSLVPFMLMMLLPLHLINYFVFQPAALARRLGYDEEPNWRLDEDGLVIRNQKGDTRIGWDQYRQAYESGEHFILVYSAGLKILHVLPKRFLTSPGQEASLRRLLESKSILKTRKS